MLLRFRPHDAFERPSHAVDAARKLDLAVKVELGGGAPASERVVDFGGGVDVRLVRGREDRFLVFGREEVDNVDRRVGGEEFVKVSEESGQRGFHRSGHGDLESEWLHACLFPEHYRHYQF